jgi:hypothetical protein
MQGDAVDEGTVEGVWWLPTAPSTRVYGRLSYGTQALRLVTNETLIAPERSAKAMTWNLGTVAWPIVHGETEANTAITLLGAESRYAPIGKHVTRAGCALLGPDVLERDAFAEVRLTFDWLTAWLCPPKIYDRGPHDDDTEMRVDLRRQSLCGVPVDSDHVEFMANAKWQLAHDAVEVQRSTYVGVRFGEPSSWREILEQHVRPLQDFLVVALGRPVQLTGMYLRPAVEPLSEDFYDVKLPLIQRDAVSETSYGHLHAFPSTVLLDGAEFLKHAEDIVPGWYDINARNRIAVIRLNAPAYARFNYLSNQCASVAQAFESLFMGECATKQKGRAAHAERVRQVQETLEAAKLDPEIVTWATNVVRARNDKSFSERFADVIGLASSFGSALVEDMPDLANDLTALRHAVAHGARTDGTGTLSGPDVDRMFYLKEIGTWIMRTALLELSGARVAASARTNARVTDAVAHLGRIPVRSEGNPDPLT